MSGFKLKATAMEVTRASLVVSLYLSFSSKGTSDLCELETERDLASFKFLVLQCFIDFLNTVRSFLFFAWCGSGLCENKGF